MEINGITDSVLQITHQQSNCHFNQFHSYVLIWLVYCEFAIGTSHSDRTWHGIRLEHGYTNPRRLADNII
jgi:hypothetical protein